MTLDVYTDVYPALSGLETYTDTYPGAGGTVTLTGAGSLVLSGAPAAAGDLTLTGDGTVELFGQSPRSGTLTLSGGGALELSGEPVADGTLTLTGGGSLMMTGEGPDVAAPVAPPEDFGLRLVCFDPTTGVERGKARAALIERYARAGEPGSLKVNFSELAPRSTLLAAPVEAAVEVYDGTTWSEPKDARYVIATDSHERTADPSGSHDLTLVGITALLSGPKVFTAPAGETQTDGKRQFLSKTPGEIIGTLLAEAKARGAVPTITAGFTATHDSNGQPWTAVYNRAYELNHSLLAILQNLYDGGAVDYWTQGRVLHMVPAGDRSRDLSTGVDPVYLRDLAVAGSPEREDWTNLADFVMLIGDEGKTFSKANPAAYAPFGRRETVILAGGVSDEGTATVMMDRALAEGADVARELTREWAWTPGTRWMPDRDLQLGDWVLADTRAGTRQRVKVADLMTRQGPDGIEAFVTLGTIADDLVTRMAKRQLGIEGGAGVGSIGRPTLPPPPDPTSQWGERPDGFTVAVTAWPIPGGYGGILAASWQEVTTDTGGFAYDPDGYIVRGRKAGGPWMDMFRTSALSGQVERTDMRPGETWEAQVAAYRGDQTGAFSTLWSGTVPEDDQAPPAPSAPLLESPVAQLVVGWDGLAAGGADMPLDVSHVEVQLDAATDPERWRITGAGGQLRLDPPAITVGVTYTVRLRAVDRAGNASGWSAPGFIAITASVAWPATPGSLLASADTYLTGEGSYRGRISASWAEVTTDTGGDPVDIDRYAVRVRRTAGWFATDWFDLFSTTALSGTGSSPLMEVGDTWEVAVAAVSADGHTGPFSTAVTLVIPPDTVAPPVPSTPVATSSLGLLTVTWDGLSQTGGGMDTDLDHLAIVITGQGMVGRIDPRVRVEHLTGLTVGTTYEVRLVAVDRAGNESDPSQPATAQVTSAITGLQERVDQIEAEWDTYDPASKIKVDAGWITNFLLIGNTDEVVIDPTWQNADLNAERARTGWTVAPGTVTHTAASPDAFYLGLTSARPGAFMQLRAGARYRIEATVRLDAPGVVGLVLWDTAINADVVMTDAAIPANTDYVLVREHVWGTSPGSYGVQLPTTGTIRNVSVRPMLSQVLIEHGLIQTPMLAAGAVDTDKLKAGSVTAGILSTDALNFKTATGLVLTAPNIQSTTATNRGLKLSTSYKRVYDNSGNITLEENYSTGDVTMTGRFQTRGAYPHLDIGRGLWADFSGLQWTIGPGWQTKPEIITNAATWGIDTPGGLYLRGGNLHGLTMRPEIALRSGRPISGTPQYWPEIDILVASQSTTRGRIRLQDIGENKTSITAWADFIRMDTKTGQQIVLNEVGSPGDIRVISPAGISLEVGNSWLMFHGLGSTTGGTDLAMEGGNRITVRSSLSADKLDQRETGPLYELLDVPAKTWVDRSRREADPAWATRYGGVVYEDVAQVSAMHGGSLDFLLIRRGGRPSGINYNAIGPALLPIVADLHARITQLEEAKT